TASEGRPARATPTQSGSPHERSEMRGPGFRSAHPGYELAGMGDAAFFGIGARSSDLDNVSRSEMSNSIGFLRHYPFRGNVRVTALRPRRVRGRVLESWSQSDRRGRRGRDVSA